MKPIIVVAIVAFLGAVLASSFVPAYAAAPGAMSGKRDWATRGYNQAAKQKQMNNAKMKKQPTKQ